MGSETAGTDRRADTGAGIAAGAETKYRWAAADRGTCARRLLLPPWPSHLTSPGGSPPRSPPPPAGTYTGSSGGADAGSAALGALQEGTGLVLDHPHSQWKVPRQCEKSLCCHFGAVVEGVCGGGLEGLQGVWGCPEKIWEGLRAARKPRSYGSPRSSDPALPAWGGAGGVGCLPRGVVCGGGAGICSLGAPACG